MKGDTHKGRIKCSNCIANVSLGKCQVKMSTLCYCRKKNL